MRAMGADYCVIVGQVGTNTNGYWLLSCSQMHLTWDWAGTYVKCKTLLNSGRKFAFHVDRCHGLFVITNLNHLLVHPE
jgi:hypothetical protein